MGNEYFIGYLISDLKRVGPTNQTLNIIKYSAYKKKSIVITLFDEENDSMIEDYEKEKIEIVCLKLNKLNYMKKGKNKLKKIINKYNLKILHSYGIRSDRLAQQVAKKENIKHIITLRNYPKEDILSRMNFFAGHFALTLHLSVLKKCKNVICCSKTIYNKMKKKYPNLNFIYIQNGVDIEKFKINESQMLINNLCLKDNEVIFISTGSFIKRKRIQETIDLFNLIPEKSKKLLLIGNGPMFDEIYLKNKDNKNIIFVGKVSNVQDYLNISNYFISTSESEGLPNGVLEAIACGNPVILSNIPQHIEILNHLDKVGYMYTLGDVNDIINKYVFYSANDYNLMKNNTQSIKQSDFTMKNMSKKYCEYYKKAVEE